MSEPLPAAAAVEHASQEMLAIWGQAMDLNRAYLSALATSPSLEGIMKANAELMAGGMNLYADAAGAMLRRHGLRAPLLSDA